MRCNLITKNNSAVICLLCWSTLSVILPTVHHRNRSTEVQLSISDYEAVWRQARLGTGLSTVYISAGVQLCRIYCIDSRKINFFMDHEFHLNTANYWSHDSRCGRCGRGRSRTSAHTLHVIFPGWNCDHRELEFRKWHGGCGIEEGIRDTAVKSKGQDILSVLPAVTRPIHTASRAGQCMICMITANSAFQHNLIRHGHGIRYVNCCAPKMSTANY